MNLFARSRHMLLFVGCMAFAVQGSEAKEVQVFKIDARTISYLPSEGIKSYQQSNEGSCGISSTVRLDEWIDEDLFYVEVTGKKRAGQVIADVVVGRPSGEEKLEVELTDMKPQSVDLGVWKDGRHHHVVFTPSIVANEAEPKSFAEEASEFGLVFSQSTVIVNDGIYVGRLGGAGEVVLIEIADVGIVEMSLHEREGWLPWGTIKNGRVTIRHPDDKTMIVIYNVECGFGGASFKLPRPYRVWVRWEKSTVTSAEAWRDAREYRKKIIADGADPEEPRLDYTDNILARDPAPLIVRAHYGGR